jgi:para-aminobenzoate synthetase/4-amino-4-deoxychorismate lyase
MHWRPRTDARQFNQAINTIKRQIEQGNTYQVNYTIRLESQFEGPSYEFYRALLNAQSASYSAYLDTGRFKILSASPELFFHLENGRIKTKPMKGTSPRGKTSAEDCEQRQQLFSEKNRAENVMIVDLLRNDLSQIAKPGSVKVEQLFAAEKYPTVWQLTSTISAEIEDKLSLAEIFKALFPCGSITGAPKASTMKLIAELEPEAREVYCGAIGYITPQRKAIFNVPIRTVIIDSHNSSAQYGVGGGITWDSTAEDEYQEIVNKTKVLYGTLQPEGLIESLLISNGDYFLYDLHLNRLTASADYFDFVFQRHDVEERLKHAAQQYGNGDWKIRLTLDRQNNIDISAQPVEANAFPITAHWALAPMDSNNPLLYHKTVVRHHYPTLTHGEEQLLYNERDEITEFVNGNVVLVINGQYLTPSVKSGLLPGTMRQHLIEQGVIREATLYRSQLEQASQIYFINSVRQWRTVHWRQR